MAPGLGQSQVNVVPAPAFEGDFATANPRSVAIAGPGGLVAGLGGCVAGRFCWGVPGALDVNTGPQVVVNSGFGPPLGLIHREMQGMMPSVFTPASLVIPQGYPVAAHTWGDFWVKNNGLIQCTFGMKAYARFADGNVTFAATGTPPAGGTSTASTIAAGTFSFTGTITGNVLTAVSGLAGTIVAGAPISGTGVTAGNTIGQQLSGTTGGLGTYSVTIGEQTVASTTISGTYGTLTVGGTVGGVWGVGEVVTGGTASAGTIITALGTGTGGAGTYIVNNTQTVGSAALAGSSAIETKFIAMMGGLVGEMIKISSVPIG